MDKNNALFSYKDTKDNIYAVAGYCKGESTNVTTPRKCMISPENYFVNITGELNENVYLSKNNERPGMIFFDVSNAGTTVHYALYPDF